MASVSGGTGLKRTVEGKLENQAPSQEHRAVIHPGRRLVVATDQRGALRIEIPPHRYHGHLRLFRRGFDVDVVGEVPLQQLQGPK